MKILIYGAGPLGSVFAAKLHQGGHDVSILARGQRLVDLREHGVVIHNTINDEWTTAQVNVVEQLAPDDVYDLIMVIMRKNNALDILPILAANTGTPDVLFLMNNAAGPGALVAALGERALIGFPSSAGYRDGHIVHCLTGTQEEPYPIPFGEVDGRITARVLRIADAIDAAPGLQGDVRTDMDAWSKYHVALLMPSMAPALYACGTDRFRLLRTRDAIILAIRAIREGFHVLRAKGLPITPKRLRLFAWLPEPLMVWGFRKRFADERMDIAMVGHANAARDEMKHLADEFMDIVRTTDVPTPNIDRLYPYFDPETSLMPDGSQDIPLDWRPLLVAALGLCATLTTLFALLIKRHKK